ncbi:MAG: 2-C-methyl-D-erythritol 4-phosphate cytidylyltransferase, partial [Bacillota bacterium]|nr:2-C-methyl-D-erythritol 4-phosphate cytidylyltransferase [Bacillota bacterium]
MYNNSKIAVIIAAAGQGTRLGAPVPKQYLKIGGEFVIAKAIKVFENMEEIDYIFLVTNEDYIERCSRIVDENGYRKIEGIVAGGRERQDSVFNAIQC